ncbi:hypothetical protein FD754_004941 [Muntiacus muntjak]|uniref:F-BAR domain-containing protein n=1 Tax=Muntiacus muntjak TaxID=9888 RepID=A0A5N3WJ78_MUNMU|nr:hypothetical protein FD754_004941 [Muntiacus muntjak]
MLGSEVAQSCLTLCDPMDCRLPGSSVHGIFQARSWLLMIQQTEQLSRIMKTHAEDLNSGPLHRLTMMIKDKQQVKKSYIGVHQQIEAEMIKVWKETEKAKERYDKATMKLHMLHNQYVLALKGAQLHQNQYYDTTLPLLLDSLQKMQEEMIKALKGIFDEYSQITSLVTEEIVNVHKEIQMSVEQIDPSTEYNNFIDVHRLRTLAEELMQTQQMLLNKEEAVLELEKRIEESSKSYERKSDIVLLLSQKQALEELKQSVQQLRCTEAKFTAQKELLEQKVQENDGKEPPPVVNYEEDARSVTSMYVFSLPLPFLLLSCYVGGFYRGTILTPMSHLEISPDMFDFPSWWMLSVSKKLLKVIVSLGFQTLVKLLFSEWILCHLNTGEAQEHCSEGCVYFKGTGRDISGLSGVQARVPFVFPKRKKTKRHPIGDFTKLSVSNAQEEICSTECSLSGNAGLILSQSFLRCQVVVSSLEKNETGRKKRVLGGVLYGWWSNRASLIKQWERQREGSDAGAFFLCCWNTKEGNHCEHCDADSEK